MKVVALTLAMFYIAAVQSVDQDPLIGNWRVNLKRTHYGGGADPRRKETFSCSRWNAGVSCTIESVRSDGHFLKAGFRAAYDGRSSPVAGIPDVDRVLLSRTNDHVADATFSFRDKPVFAYRAVRSSDGNSLTIVSVDPVTRAVLQSVVVYDRR